MKVGISIPMYNEEGAAEQVLHQIMYVLREAHIPFCLAVVNNGSKDSTGSIIDHLANQFEEITPLHMPTNQGYGGGILAGMRALETQGVDIIGWMWGDGQVLPDVLPELVNAIKDGFNIAKAQRIERKDGWKRKAISKLYSLAMKPLKNQVEDVNGCPKLMLLSNWNNLQITSIDWFIDAQTMLKAQEQHLKIYQEPVVMEKRIHNESKVNVLTWMEFLINISKWKWTNR